MFCAAFAVLITGLLTYFSCTRKYFANYDSRWAVTVRGQFWCQCGNKHFNDTHLDYGVETGFKFWCQCGNKHFNDTHLDYGVETGFKFRRGQTCFLFHIAHQAHKKKNLSSGCLGHLPLWQSNRIIMQTTQNVMKLGMRGVIPPVLKNMSTSLHH